MNKFKSLISLLAIVLSVSAFAANIVCKGRVVDANDLQPLIGATIMVENTNIGTATDLNGNFTIKTPEGSTLRVSYVGFCSQQFKARTNVGTITLQANEAMLGKGDPEPEPTPEEVEKWVEEGLDFYDNQKYEEAFRKFRDASYYDNPRAESLLAICYRDGIGTKKDEQEFAVYMFASAKHGYAPAQYVMGIMYRDGDGVAKNLRLAEEYLRKAADQGYNDAKIALFDLTSGK